MPFGGRLVDEEVARVGLGVGVPGQHAGCRARAPCAARVEMPPRFSTATAITSTLRVIQFSTSSFCCAASRLGRAVPDQLDAELPRRFLGAGAAADEVRIALRLRHHRRSPAGAPPAPAPAAPPTVRAAGAERSDQPDVGAGDDQRARDDRRRTGRRPDCSSPRISSSSDGARRPRRRAAQAIERDRGEQQHAGQHAGQLRRQRREVQPVLQHRQREQAEQRAPQRAAAAEHRRAAEHDGGDRVELVAGAGVRLRLPEMRDVDDRREARRPAPTARRRAPTRRADRDAGVARALGGEPDRVQRAADRPSGAAARRTPATTSDEQRQLRRDRRRQR